MRIRSIELEGFRSWRDPQTVDLANKNLVGVVGLNRAGKTSLLAAIEFACWGTTRGATVADVINRDSKQARVVLEFDTADNTYRIERIRTRTGRHEVLFTVADPTMPSGWRELTEKHPNVADPAIVAAIGMDETTSALTWLVRQNDYGAFCNLSPAQRRIALISAFQLGRFADLAERAEQLRRDAERATDRAKWEVESVSARLADAEAQSLGDEHELAGRVDVLTGRLEQVAGVLAGPGEATRQAVEALRRVREDHERAVAEVGRQRAWLERETASLAGRIAAAESRVEQAIAAAARRDELAGRLVELQQSVDRIRTKLDSYAGERTRIAADVAAHQTTLVAHQQRAQELADRIVGLSHTDCGRCVVCSSELPAERAASLLADAQREADETASTIDGVRATVGELQAAEQAVAGRIREGENRLKNAQQAVEHVHSELARARNAAELADTHHQETTELAAELAGKQAELDELADPVLDGEKVAELERAAAGVDVSALQAEQVRLRAELQQATEQLALHRRATSQAAEAAHQLDLAQQTQTRAQQRVDDLTCIRDEFRPAGIPARIVAGVLDELNVEANSIMEATGDDGLQVMVSTVRTTVKGGLSEAVTVYAITPDGQQADWATLSGSEQFRVALGIRVGLARCIARRTGVPIRTIIIDEGWGNLDEPTRQRVAGVLAALATEFQVLTVSHIDDVKASFPHVVWVDGGTGTSVATTQPT